MSKPPAGCSIGGCANPGESRELAYWPGGMSQTRGARPSLPICEDHLPVVQAKLADPRHWRAVYHVGVLSFRPTGVSAAAD